ncbi:MAG: glycosyltransferase [Thalassobaculales bacterium]
MAMLVHAMGWFAGRFGYNTHTRGLFGALSRLRPVVATWLPEQAVAPDRAAIAAAWPGRPVASIALLPGELCGVLSGAPPGPRIACTVWESTRLPDNWLPPLLAADQVWIPSAWGRNILVDNGIPADRVKVVPEGVDPALFHPGVPPAPFLAAKPGFKVLAVGKWERRKGLDVLIRAFERAFGERDEAWLVLACDNPFRSVDLRRELVAAGLRRPGRLLVVPPVARPEVFAGLYTACDLFCLPTRAEGWGLPIIEAAACGLPVVVTGWGGQSEFLGDWARLIGHRLVPVDGIEFERADGDRGLWAEPDEDHLVALLREAHADRAAARARGRAGAAAVAAAFTWEHAARTAHGLLA